MNIFITKKEFDAIWFGICQIQGDVEGASDEEFIESASEAINNLNEIVRKYKQAKVRSDKLKALRHYIRSKNDGIPQAKVDKMARLLLKRSKENEKQES